MYGRRYGGFGYFNTLVTLQKYNCCQVCLPALKPKVKLIRSADQKAEMKARIQQNLFLATLKDTKVKLLDCCLWFIIISCHISPIPGAWVIYSWNLVGIAMSLKVRPTCHAIQYDKRENVKLVYAAEHKKYSHWNWNIF